METINYSEIREKIEQADAILVGASNGLSITEGLHIFADNQDFRTLFGDFREKYGIRSILQGIFFAWPNEEARWAFYSRLIQHYSGNYTGSSVMDALKEILKGKPYFIVTSNGENHFELAGFDVKNILEMEGSWKEMHCMKECSDELYPTFPLMRELAAEEKDGEIPSQLVPRCPKCGGKMQINFRPEEEQVQAYRNFIKEYHGKKLLVLELGIGAGNQMIKAPFMNLVYAEPKAFYITVNKGEVFIPKEIMKKSIGVDADLGGFLPKLVGQEERREEKNQLDKSK